ncbi:MAG: recombinase family protein [Dehalococcoidia bacterium]
MSQAKVLPTHLKRQAVIYIRQSSPQQVQENLESQRRQYQLTERAQSLGWPAAQCLVIDDDQALSGAQSYNRSGYQHLISLIALRQVGIVLGLEVSRLARNNLDWYQLLELAAAFDVLIADEDGLYDPANFNDRLLLGLKGTISEAELYQMRARMVRGRLNKARRGELTWPPPVGLEVDPLTQKTRPAVDQSVRHSLELVFHLFRQLHSTRGVLHYFYREGLELPYRRSRRGLGSEIGWRRPSYDALYQILTHPAYAGVYGYGRRQRQVDPLTHAVHFQRLDRSQWTVFIPDHHPGYITLAEFEQNQRILENNGHLYPKSQGAASKGPALLQGLVYCQHCGYKMRVRYSQGKPSYTCDIAHRRFGEPVCNRASARRVDALVEELFLTVVQPQTLELSLSCQEKLRAEAALVDRSWQEKLQRLTYQAELARRRYELVDPENRLVAQTLEAEWNRRLMELEEARRAYERERPTACELSSAVAQMQHVVAHLREYWFAETMTDQDKKELLRCLIERVFLESRGKVIGVRVYWYGGASSELDVPKHLFSAPHLYHRIEELARHHTDPEIADSLNQAGIKTVKDKPWTARRVMNFRLFHRIASGFTTHAELRLPETGYITSAEAAAQLGVSQSTIQRWYKLGILSGKHDGGQSPLWIRWTPEVMDRLQGGATPDPRMAPVRSLCRAQGRSSDQVMVWARQAGHEIYRLRRGSKLLFFVLPTESFPPMEQAIDERTS